MMIDIKQILRHMLILDLIRQIKKIVIENKNQQTQHKKSSLVMIRSLCHMHQGPLMIQKAHIQEATVLEWYKRKSK